MNTKRIKQIAFLSLTTFALIPVGRQSATASEMRPQLNMPTELKSFSNCQDLNQHIADNFKFNHYGRNFLGPASGRGGGMDDAKEMEAPAAPAEKRKSGRGRNLSKLSLGVAKSLPNNVTGTNNQVAGVDEADFVKTDGQYIYQVSGSTLHIVKAWPANSMAVQAKFALQGTAKDILLGTNKIVVIGQSNSGGTKTHLQIVDISNKSNPSLVSTFNIPGTMLAGRRVGSAIRVATTDWTSRINPIVSTSAPVQREDGDADGWLIKRKPTHAVTQQATSTGITITPTTRTHSGTTDELDTLGSCKHVYVPKDNTTAPFVRLATIHLNHETYSESLAYMSPQHVYASAKGIYFAQQYNDYNVNKSLSGFNQKTMIYRFGFDNPQRTVYSGAGDVNGHLLNQFSMDEHKGYLRVATTGSYKEGKFWKNGANWKQVNQIQVLDASSSSMNKVGESKHLAENERIYSVRFHGDKGFMVTFRQVDPLFTLDLSNPRRPRAIGELKVPGFSTYIHVLSNGRLLAIGKDADERTGRARGLKISMFDVSKFEKPRELDTLLFRQDARSEASIDHKAFSYYAEKGTLAIPITGTRSVSQRGLNGLVSTKSARSSLLLFKVDAKSIKTAGEVDMTDMLGTNHGSHNWQNQAKVRRSIFMDDFVYAIGNAGIRAAKIDQPEKPVGTIKFSSSFVNLR